MEVTVDRSRIDIKTPGEYEVTYTARDRAGNETSMTAIITLSPVKITEEQLDAAADAVLADLVNDRMTLAEKTWEIYKYVNTHVRYWDSSDKNDWRAEAYRGITEGWGDCFTYFSVSQILLTKIGAEILAPWNGWAASLTIIGTSSIWMAAGITSMPVSTNRYTYRSCAPTPNSTNLRQSKNLEYNYYTYDKTKYPAVSTVPFEWDRSEME